MPNGSALWYFESVNLYKILCPDKVKKMSERHKFIKYKRQQFIYVPDNSATQICLVVGGKVKIGHYLDGGEELLSAMLNTGEIFGALAIAGAEPKSFAQAIEETIICLLTIEDLKMLMYENKELSFKILKLIGLRIMKLERKIELLIFKDARTRVIEFLKDAAEWKGKKVGLETVIQTSFTHKDIASLTGTSRQKVTTILNGLKEDNMINFNRKQILIRDLENLN